MTELGHPLIERLTRSERAETKEAFESVSEDMTEFEEKMLFDILEKYPIDFPRLLIKFMHPERMEDDFEGPPSRYYDIDECRKKPGDVEKIVSTEKMMAKLFPRSTWKRDDCDDLLYVAEAIVAFTNAGQSNVLNQGEVSALLAALFMVDDFYDVHGVPLAAVMYYIGNAILQAGNPFTEMEAENEQLKLRNQALVDRIAELENGGVPLEKVDESAPVTTLASKTRRKRPLRR
jgi:hypothetical protein